MRSWQPIVGVIALVGAVALPSPVRAQVDLVPALGFYWPVGGWTQEEDGGTGFPPLRRQLSAALVGARLSFPVSPRLALEGTLSMTPSQVAVSTVNGTTDYDGGVFLASARALFNVVTLTDRHTYDDTRWDVILGAGVGVVHRAGTAWENTSGVTAPALALEAGVRVGTFRITFEDFVSWAQFNGGRPSQTRARMHHDLIASLGFAVRLGGR